MPLRVYMARALFDQAVPHVDSNRGEALVRNHNYARLKGRLVAVAEMPQVYDKNSAREGPNVLLLGDSSSRTRSGGQAPGGRLRSFLAALIGARGDEADDRAVCLERGLTPALPAFVSLRHTQAPAVLDHGASTPAR